MDCIFLREFRLDLVIGVHDWERQLPQTVQLDLEIGLPHSRACHTDRVEDTIDYARVVERLRADLAERRHALVEAVAERVATILIGEFGSPWVRVSVTKLGLVRGVKYLGVTIERGEK
jgi:dihydroneopterin aldolase